MVALDFSPAQEEAFKAAYRHRRRLQLVLAVPMFVVVTLALLELGGLTDLAGRLGLASWAVPTLAVAVLLGALATTLLVWRCPACRSHLAVDLSPSYCRHCGCAFD